MKELKGSKTLQNLINAFAGESQARNRYTFYAKAAQKEGYQQIAGIFLETAENEQVHGKEFFKLIISGLGAIENPEKLTVNADYPVLYGSTVANLKAAAAGENEEHTLLYPQAADTAQEEGYPEVAAKFRNVAQVEVEHEKRYLKLLKNINENKVYKKDEPVKWKCRKCGYIHYGTEPPEKCPACAHPKEYYEMQCENY